MRSIQTAASSLVAVPSVTTSQKVVAPLSTFDISRIPQVLANPLLDVSRDTQGTCSLSITALPQPASQTVAVGTIEFDFAHIQFTASPNCNVTLNKVVVGVDNNVSGPVSNVIQNLKVFKSGIQIGNSVTLPTWANVIGSNLNISIPAGTSIVLVLKADIVDVGSANIRLGESYTEAVRAGTTIQVGNGFQYWGQWMHLKDSCSTLYLMQGFPDWITDIWSTKNGVTWTKILQNTPWYGNPPAAPFNVSRERYGVTTLNNNIWILGGSYGGGWPWLNDVWKSADGMNWTQVTPHAPWSTRAQVPAVGFMDKLWIFGGYNGYYYNDIWSSLDGINWTQVTTAAPWSTRAGHAALVFNNRLWILGGLGMVNAGNGNFYFGTNNDVWTSSDGVNWVQATAHAPWSGRYGFGAVVYNNKMWVMGGILDWAPGTLTNDVWYSSDGINWTKATGHAPWLGRGEFSVSVFNNRMWVISGDDGINAQINKEVWTSTDGANWTEVTNQAPWLGRLGPATTVLNNCKG